MAPRDWGARNTALLVLLGWLGGLSISEHAQLRLVNGSSRCSGRVEVLHNQKWGTVCDEGWDLQDAGVVCRQLGCGTALSAPGLAEFGEGSDPIWLAEVNCTGTEATLSECRASPWGGKNCTQRKDASVDCSGLTISEHTQLRLVNGPSRCAGRVEVLHDQQWGAVCDRSWDTNDAKVVCRQLACGAVLSVPDKAWFGEGSDPIWLDEINCTGTEASLTECRARLWGDHNCTHEEDAGVVCSEQSQLRLVNSQSRCTGRLEVLHNQQWGTVCDHSWDLRDAEVVCRQLSCGTALSAPGRAQFGEGSDPIWLNDVHCTGTEEAITECRAKPWGVHNCTHGETAGVVCSEPAQLQLVNGPHRCAGRVEVFLSQQWGTVCDDDWDFLDARVVCKQLGCGMASLAPHEAHFGRGSHLIWLDHVNCSGTEAALSECRARPWGVHDCNHREDASVVCSGPAMSLGVWLLRSALVLLLLGSAPIITCILEKGAPILPEPLRTGNGNKGQPGEDPAMGEESVIYANVPSLLAPRDLSERCTDGEDTSNTGLRGSLAWNREMAASAPSVQTFHPPCLLH